MSKKVLTGILILIFSVVTVAFAVEFATDSKTMEKIIVSETVQTVDFKKFAMANISKATQPEKFASIVNCNNEAKLGNVSSYISFMTSHSFTDEQSSVIYEVLDNGTTIQSLIQVYDFWLTTDEPFSIIADICELEDKYLNLYWYEDAFNELTENSHGVMEPKDIKEYNRKGISNDVIMCANVLSRKRGQNIYDILDSVIDGDSLEEIACDIYKVDYFEKSDNLYEDILLFCQAKGNNISVVSPDYKEQLKKFTADSESVIKLKTEESLKMLGIDTSNTEDDSFKSMIKLPGYDVRTYYAKGYTYEEIYLASLMDDSDILSQLKYVREGMSNE